VDDPVWRLRVYFTVEQDGIPDVPRFDPSAEIKPAAHLVLYHQGIKIYQTKIEGINWDDMKEKVEKKISVIKQNADKYLETYKFKKEYFESLVKNKPTDFVEWW